MEYNKNKKLQGIFKRRKPNLSHIKPPTESAASKMVRNLKAAGAVAAKKRNKS